MREFSVTRGSKGYWLHLWLDDTKIADVFFSEEGWAISSGEAWTEVGSLKGVHLG